MKPKRSAVHLTERQIGSFYNFYHTMDYAMARCLSIHPSVCHKAKHTLFSPRCSYTILPFPYHTLWQYSDRDPHNVASNAGDYKKIAVFDQYLTLSRK